MRRALDLLEVERAATRQQGRGTYVTDHSSDAHLSRFWRIGRVDELLVAGDSKTIDIVQTPASAEECRRLRLRPGDEIFRVRSISSNGKIPFMFEEASLPATLFGGCWRKRALHTVLRRLRSSTA
jgi:DNA-binding GntR family transcriptional regulator